MTPMKNDELLDDLIDRRRRGESADRIIARLPADFALTDLSIVESRQLVLDLLALDDNVRGMPLPQPSKIFADGVMAALAEPVSTASTGSIGRWAVWSGTAAAAIAATLLIAVNIAPKNEPQGPAVAAISTPAVTDAPTVTVNDAVRHGTEAYIELFQDIASTLPAEEKRSPEKKQVQLASATPIGRAIQGSSETIRTAGQGLRVSVEPITNTALDAFGFLWRPAGAEDSKQPSI